MSVLLIGLFSECWADGRGGRQGEEGYVGKRLDVLGKTLRRFRKNVRTFQVKRLDVFFGQFVSLVGL